MTGIPNLHWVQASASSTLAMRPYALLVLIAALSPSLLGAQDPDTIPVFAGGHLLFANPVGEFDENVDFGFGLGAHVRLPVDDDGTLSLRLDLGFINYGNETIRICITQPCRVTGDLTTRNNIFLLGIGPEIGVGSGAARLYANASIGLAYFATTSSVEGENELGDPSHHRPTSMMSHSLGQRGRVLSSGSGGECGCWSRSTCSLDTMVMARRATFGRETFMTSPTGVSS